MGFVVRSSRRPWLDPGPSGLICHMRTLHTEVGLLLTTASARPSRAVPALAGKPKQAAVQNYLNGGTWELVGEFTEVESGGKSQRPELAKALALCRKQKATLLIARLDRLARNVHFISGLMETKVQFVACDMPEATPFMLHIYAAVAQEEAERSPLGPTALAAAKQRGVRLGASGLTRNEVQGRGSGPRP